MKGKNIAASVWKTAVVAVLAFLLCFSQLLFSFDKLIADPLYQSSRRGDYRIRILAIDEKSIAAYGNPADWSREIPARLVTLLDGQDASAPALIVFDVMYGGHGPVAVPNAIIDDGIALCDRILAGTDDALEVPSLAPGRTGRLAAKRGDNYLPLSGGLCNIVYAPNSLTEPPCPPVTGPDALKRG